MSHQEYVLAQYNVATMRYPVSHAGMAEFVACLDDLNRLADASPGFVWRLQDASGDSTGIRVPGGDERMLVNMSVWKDAESLFAYAYRSDHVSVFRRRGEWFLPHESASLVLWWVPRGIRPSVADAEERLARLRRDGPGPQAFTLKKRLPPPGNDAARRPTALRPEPSRFARFKRGGRPWAR